MGPDLIRETSEKVSLIRQRLQPRAGRRSTLIDNVDP